MRLAATTIALLSVTIVGLASTGCAAAHKPQASAPEAYDWSDYKGTYAGPSESAPTTRPEAGKGGAAKVADAKSGGDPKAEMLGDAGGAGATKKSRATIQGESVSSVSVDAVAGASKATLKYKVVSSNVVVGREYEQLQVVMKGVAVQIIRPAATPDVAGPKVRSPKIRSASIAKNESGWYDPDANVLVLVKANKKAASQKTLAAILTR